MKKRILFLMALNFWSISQGKGAPSVFNTINGYVKAGWDVHVVMRQGAPNFGSAPENLHLHPFEYPRLQKLMKKPHLSVPVMLLVWLLANRKYRSLGSRIIREHGIDVVYAYEVEGVPAARRLARRHGLPLVTRFMGTVLADKLRSVKYRIALWPHFVGLRAKADLVVMTNDGTRGRWVLEQLKNASPDIRFWLNGVNRVDLSGYDAEQARQTLGVPAGAKTLLCVSRLVGWKRLDRSLRAFRLVSDAYSGEVRLVIVGDGDMRPQLEALAQELDIAGKVVFTGGLPQAKVYHAMKFADVFLSLYDLSNMGNPLFEAMRVGKPVVTMDNGDTATIIRDGDNGLLLPDGCGERAIADAILSLLGDEALASRLAANAARAAQEQFRTWDERIAEEVDAVGMLAAGKG